VVKGEEEEEGEAAHSMDLHVVVEVKTSIGTTMVI